MVKRMRALLESNRARNSQPETHPDDGGGRVPVWARPHRMERFPDAWENSSRNLPRSGILFIPRREVRFEFCGRQIAERGVKPLLVVDLFEELADRCAGLGQIAILVAVDLFLL